MENDILKIYQAALNLKKSDFPQCGKGYYLYNKNQSDDIANKKPTIVRLENKTKSFDSEVYVPTKQELIEECKKNFKSNFFKYFSAEYFSSIIVDINISENRETETDEETNEVYTIWRPTEDSIFFSLTSLYLNLLHLEKLEYSKKQIIRHSVMWFLAGAAVAVYVIIFP